MTKPSSPTATRKIFNHSKGSTDHRHSRGVHLVLLSLLISVLYVFSLQEDESSGGLPLLLQRTFLSTFGSTNTTDDSPILSPKDINKNIIINGVSYSLDLVDIRGKPILQDPNQVTSAATLSAALPLPQPILIMGLPQTGMTSTMHTFFRKAGYKKLSSGKDAQIPTRSQLNQVGQCLREAIEIKHSKTPLKDCGNYNVWTQLEVLETMAPTKTAETPTASPESRNGNCTFPQISYLEQLHQEAPNATFVIGRRNLLDPWIYQQFQNRALDKRLSQCDNSAPASANRSDIIAWHLHHIQRIRQFVQDHPSHALIEIDMQDPNTATRMAKAFSTRAKSWPRLVNYKR